MAWPISANYVRNLGLFEGTDEFDRVTPRLGKAEAGIVSTDTTGELGGDFGPLSFNAPVTEKPLLGSTEQWNLFNFTEDTHPIYLHLPQFQVFEKWHIDFLDTNEDGIPDDTTGDGLISYGAGSTPDYTQADIWIGDKVNLRPEETGLQDTITSTRTRWPQSSRHSTGQAITCGTATSSPMRITNDAPIYRG